MELSIRELNELDYDNTLYQWWVDWGWNPLPKDFLPKNGTGGWMVMDGEIPVCAGFLYETNSGMSICDPILSNKEYKDRGDALRLLIAKIHRESVHRGYRFCYAMINNKSLIAIYKEFGYVKGDDYRGEMIKKHY